MTAPPRPRRRRQPYQPHAEPTLLMAGAESPAGIIAPYAGARDDEACPDATGFQVTVPTQRILLAAAVGLFHASSG